MTGRRERPPTSDWRRGARSLSPLADSSARPPTRAPRRLFCACGGCLEHGAPGRPVSGVFLQPPRRARPAAFLLLPSPGPWPHKSSPSPLPRRSPGPRAQRCGHVASRRGSMRRRSRASRGASSRSRAGSERAPPDGPRGSRRRSRLFRFFYISKYSIFGEFTNVL